MLTNIHNPYTYGLFSQLTTKKSSLSLTGACPNVQYTLRIFVNWCVEEFFLEKDSQCMILDIHSNKPY